MTTNRRVYNIVYITGFILALVSQAFLAYKESIFEKTTSFVFLLLAGAFLFAFGNDGSIETGDGRIYSVSPLGTILPEKFGITKFRFITFLLGFISLLFLVFRLVTEKQTGLFELILWMVVLLVFYIGFFESIPGIGFPGKISRCQDVFIVLGFVIIYFVLNAHDIYSWYYSSIGDEYPFRDIAASIIQNGVINPFSQRGGYGDYHPILGSVYQAFVMLIFGNNHFGWVFGSVISIVIAIPGIYILAFQLGNRKVAVVAAAVFSFSHYIFGYSHIGYNNLHSLAPTIWALVLLIHALKKGNRSIMFLAGIVTGIGFYTIFSGRLIIAIIAVFILTVRELRRNIFRLFWPFLFGFGATLLPMLIVSFNDIFALMLEVVGTGKKVVNTSVSLYDLMLSNIKINFIAYNYCIPPGNPTFVAATHYATGSYLDPASALFGLLGTALALRFIKEIRYRLLIIWLSIGLFTTAVISPYYGSVAQNRLMTNLPELAILAGFGAISIWTFIAKRISPDLKKNVNIFAAMLLVLVILALNVQRFWFVTPQRTEMRTESIALQIFKTVDPGNVAFIGDNLSIMQPMLLSYFDKDNFPNIISYDSILNNEASIDKFKCLILFKPEDEKSTLVLEKLQKEDPSLKLKYLTDFSHSRKVPELSREAAS